MLPNSPTVQIAKDISEIKKKLIAIESREPRGDWGHVVANILALPGLRGCWNMHQGYIGASATQVLVDLSSQERHLTLQGAPTLGQFQTDDFPEIPFSIFNGANQWYSRTDEAGIDITADVTLFGWFRFDDATPAAAEHLIGKWATAANRSYRLARTAAGIVRLEIFDGALTVQAGGNVTTAGAWNFIAGTFEPGVRMSGFLNDVVQTLVAGVPAASNNSNADFTIAARSGGADFTDGDAALCGLCAASLDNDTIFAMFESSRKFFGV